MQAESHSADYADVTEEVYVDSQGSRWRLALNESTNPPTPVFVAVNTWDRMELMFATWNEAEAAGYPWSIAEGL